MGGRLGAVPTERHATPTSGMILSPVVEPESAIRPFTEAHKRKIDLTDEVTAHLCERLQ